MLPGTRLFYLERLITALDATKGELRDAVGELAHEVRTLQQQNAQMKEALEKCFVGGNSIASVIIGWCLPAGYEKWSYEQGSKYFYDKYDEDTAYEYYETWLCWKSIKEAAEMVEGNPQ